MAIYDLATVKMLNIILKQLELSKYYVAKSDIEKEVFINICSSCFRYQFASACIIPNGTKPN
jgi:hypothetical protein